MSREKSKEMGEQTQEAGFSATTGEQGRQAAEGLSGGSFGHASGDSSLERHVLSVADAVLQGKERGDATEGIVVLPLPEFSFARGELRFVREGDDLVLKVGTGEGVQQIVVEGYFTASPPPTLTMGAGGQLSPALVASFLEQGEFAQKYALGWLQEQIQGKFGANDGGMQAIGEVVSAEGLVQVVRDGLVMRLKAGDMVLEGDIVSTGEGAEVFMRFTDKMEFRLGEDARLAIDQYLYDEVSSSGIQVLSIIAGAFSYASGLIAGASPASVRLQTPQGVIGIRGTTILGEVREDGLSVTVLEGRIALLQDDREVAVLDASFETLRIVSGDDGISQTTTKIASVAEVLETYDFLDGSEQQLRALEAGEPLEDEGGGDNDVSDGETGNEAGETEEVALLSDGGEVYIVAPVAEEEERSFLDKGEREAVAGVDAEGENSEESSEENSGADDVVDVEEIVDVAPAPAPPVVPAPPVDELGAGELSFAGSSVNVRFSFFSGIGVFDEVAGIVYRQGADVEVVRQEKSEEPGAYEFLATGVVDATGGQGADTLIGDGEANRLRGGVGDDTLGGGAGDDILEGGAGNDILGGGAGADTYQFRANDGTNSIADDGGKIVFLQGGGNDYAGADYAFTRADGGRGEAVTLTVEDNNGNTINTIEFTTYPSSGYTFYTRDTNDIDTEIPASSLVVPPRLGTESNPFSATDAADTFTGSAGADWVSYAGSTNIRGVRVDLRTDPAYVSDGAAGDTLTNINNLIGSGRSDNLVGNSGDNIMRGGDDNDVLSGGVGADILDGGTGNDNLHGGVGGDTLDGGAGEDAASYYLSGKGVRVSLLLQGQTQQDFEANSHGFTANGNEAVGDIISNIEQLQGSSHGDWLTGDGNDNTLNGHAGNDRLEGGGGIDYLSGETGDDHLEGSAGDDILYGGVGADTLDGGAGEDAASYYLSAKGVRVSLLLQGQAQIDFDGTHGFTANQGGEAVGDILSNIEEIIGSASFNDWLTGDGNENLLSGWGGDDRLEGGAGVDTYAFSINGGTDTIIDDGGKIVFEQRGSNDYAGATYTFTRPDPAGDAVTLTVSDSGGNTINVIKFSDDSSGYSFYTRSNGIDTEIPASSLVVPPRVGDGSEQYPFLATDVADTIAGAADKDWVSYVDSPADSLGKGVTIDISPISPNPAIVSGGWAAGDTITGINNIIGSVGEDTLTGNNNVNILRGGAGADILDGGTGYDTYVFYAGDGADTIQGDTDGGKLQFKDAMGLGDFSFVRKNNGDLTISVGSDSVTIEAAAYADGRYILYYDASDTLTGRIVLGTDGDDKGTAEITGALYADWLVGFAGDDTLKGLGDNDILFGGDGDDTLEGGGAYDILEGGAGADTLDGGQGGDTASYETSGKGVRVNLLLQGGGQKQRDFEANSYGFTANNNDAVGDIFSSIEHIRGSQYDDWLTGDNDFNVLRGNDGNDYLFGNGYSDTLHGGDGNDRLFGGDGDDFIYGGDGNDFLYGGRDDDIYGFEVGGGTDTIIDEAGDTMTLRFGVVTNSHTAADFVTANFNRVGDNLVITIDKDLNDGITDKITIENAYDTDTSTGTGNAAFTINIEFGNNGAYTLVTDDFWHGLT